MTGPDVPADGCDAAAMTLMPGLPLTYRYGGVRTFGYLAGAGGLSVVLVYLAVNIATVRAFRTEFRLWRHLLMPVTAAVLRIRSPASFETLGRVFMPAKDNASS